MEECFEELGPLIPFLKDRKTFPGRKTTITVSGNAARVTMGDEEMTTPGWEPNARLTQSPIGHSFVP